MGIFLHSKLVSPILGGNMESQNKPAPFILSARDFDLSSRREVRLTSLKVFVYPSEMCLYRGKGNDQNSVRSFRGIVQTVQGSTSDNSVLNPCYESVRKQSRRPRYRLVAAHSRFTSALHRSGTRAHLRIPMPFEFNHQISDFLIS